MAFLFGLFITDAIIFAIVQAITHSHGAAVAIVVVYTIGGLLYIFNKAQSW